MVNKLALDSNVWFDFVEKLKFDLVDKLYEGVRRGELKIMLPEFVEFFVSK